MQTVMVRPLDWRQLLIGAGIAGLAVVNSLLVIDQLLFISGPGDGADFTGTFTHIVTLDNPFESKGWLWSPLAVPILAVFVPLGVNVWGLLHVLALGFIRPWPVAVLVGMSWPFWWDIGTGNVGVFVFVAAWMAVSGSRIGTVAFLVLALLMPRPLMLPVLAWVLWYQPWTRIPFVVGAMAQFGIVAGMGLLDDWIVRATEVLPKEELKPVNWAPSRWIGYLPWAVVCVPLSIWLTVKGRLGLASIAASPYLFPFYLLMGFLELRPVRRFRLDGRSR